MFAEKLLEKEKAHQIVDQMQDTATWDDLIRQIYVRMTIENGLEDRMANRTSDVMEIRAKYGFSE